MELVFGVVFLLAGIWMLAAPASFLAWQERASLFNEREFIERSSIGRRWVRVMEPARKPITRLLGAIFIGVGGLVAVGQWPPG